MISIGSTRQDERAFDALLTKPHGLFIRVQLLDLDHNYKKDLSPYFVDGQVSVDTDSDVTRSLDITFLDPTQKISLDFDDPSATSVYLVDMIRVQYIMWDPNTGNKSFTCPIFTGPVDDVERDAFNLNVKCVGKESLGLSNPWVGKHYKAKQSKLYVIKSILQDLMGETRLQIPDTINGGKVPRLPNDMKVSRNDIPWKVAKHLADSMNCQLFYDGRGVAVLRKKRTQEVWRLDENYLAADPNLSYDLSTTINAVRVIGGTPKKAKKPVKSKAVAQRGHPLSPWRLGRSGQPRYLWMTIQDDSLRTKKECRDVAKKALAHGLKAGITIAVDGIVNPRLQEMDVIRVRTDRVTATLPLRKFTIPLTAGTAGSYGYLRKIRPRGTRHPHPHNRNRRAS